MTRLNHLKLFGLYAGISFRAQMQYKASFLLQSVANLVGSGLDILAIWVLFDRFGHLKGWTLPEVALFYGMIHISFAIAESVGRGFDSFSGMVRTGEFDRILLRPRHSAFQIAAREIQLVKIGRFTQGLLMLLYGVFHLHISWNIGKILLMITAVISGSAFFYGLFVLQATFCFWSTESLEIFNTVTYGGTETAQYPLSIYRKWFRRIFIFIIPLACATYFPGVAIIGKTDPLGSPAWFQWTSPLLGFVFLTISLKMWKFGVRHYRSTGS
ncbi:ABC-2 family transporter protein [bacterium]|nr:ABC-2 family transporter protein [bacterium]